MTAIEEKAESSLRTVSLCLSDGFDPSFLRVMLVEYSSCLLAGEKVAKMQEHL